jgi:type II secretory pathway pseudopilin PulG
MYLLPAWKNKEKGFSYPELLIVVIILALVAFYTVPLYKQFNALQEIKSTSSILRDQIRISHSKSLNGIVPSNGMLSNWVTHVHHNGYEYEYETAACPIMTNPGVTGYSNRYTFNNCQNRSDYKLYAVPLRLAISHQYTSESEANLFFASITGELTVYDQSGNVLGNVIDIKISSTEYPSMYTILHVNSKGEVSQENFTGS